MIKFQCVRCRQRIGVPEAHAGRSVSCPTCQANVKVPMLEPEEPAAEESLDLDLALPRRNWQALAKMLGELDREAGPTGST